MSFAKLMLLSFLDIIYKIIDKQSLREDGDVTNVPRREGVAVMEAWLWSETTALWIAILESGCSPNPSTWAKTMLKLMKHATTRIRLRLRHVTRRASANSICWATKGHSQELNLHKVIYLYGLAWYAVWIPRIIPLWLYSTKISWMTTNLTAHSST